MKIHKKIGLGTATMLLTLLAGYLFLSHRVFAVEVENFTQPISDYRITSFKNGKPETVKVTIQGQYSNDSGTLRDDPTRPFQETLTFQDKNTTDNILNLAFQSSSAGSNTVLCSLPSPPSIDYSVPSQKASSDTGYYNASLKNLTFGQDPGSCVPSSPDHYDEVAITDGLVYDLSMAGAPAPGSTTATPPTSTANSCESNLNSSFDWIICPALRGVDHFAGVLNDFVENQSCVNTNENVNGTVVGSSTAGAVSCPGTSIYGADIKNGPKNGVKIAWSTFKNIASALLVILMLVMVISQAFGGGPFDAYTVRKVLPKIVAAVILIQLSWVITKFAIDLSNDLGKGIQSLLFAPFGGENSMSLDKLVGANLHTTSEGATDSALFLTAIAAGVGALAVSWAGLALLALYVVLALFTAFVVLVLRKLFLILLIILAPVALILWILPGTEKYWKMWQDNFTKLLLMFPIIMGLIAAGRIFAYITAGSPASTTSLVKPHLAFVHFGQLSIPYIASVTKFVDLVIVLLAYFGPYFLLPKAFQWGGAMMNLAGKGVQAGLERTARPAKEYLQWRQGLSPWRQARAARRAEVERRTKLGFYEGLGSTGLRGRYRRARLGGPEALIPRLGRRDRELRGRIVQQAEQEIEKQRREDIQRATVQLMQHDLPQFHPGDHDSIRRAIIRGDTITAHRTDGTAVQFDGGEYARAHAYGQRAALDRGVVHGHWREIEEYASRTMASGDQQRISELQDFLQANAQTIGDQMTHLLKGMNIAATSRPENIVKMRQEEIESILGTLSTRAAGGDTAAADQLNIFLRNYATTAADGRLRTQLDQGGARAVKAFVDAGTATGDAMIRRINFDPDVANRNGYGLDLIDGRVARALAGSIPTVGAATTSPAVAAAVSDLSRRISEDGVIIR